MLGNRRISWPGGRNRTRGRDAISGDSIGLSASRCPSAANSHDDQRPPRRSHERGDDHCVSFRQRSQRHGSRIAPAPDSGRISPEGGASRARGQPTARRRIITTSSLGTSGTKADPRLSGDRAASGGPVTTTPDDPTPTTRGVGGHDGSADHHAGGRPGRTIETALGRARAVMPRPVPGRWNVRQR